MDTAAYLRRIGLDDPGPPTGAALHRLHRAHVERVPYETIKIQLVRPATVDPHESGVQAPHDPAPVGATGNHLALTVENLPTAANPGTGGGSSTSASATPYTSRSRSCPASTARARSPTS